MLSINRITGLAFCFAALSADAKAQVQTARSSALLVQATLNVLAERTKSFFSPDDAFYIDRTAFDDAAGRVGILRDDLIPIEKINGKPVTRTTFEKLSICSGLNEKKHCTLPKGARLVIIHSLRATTSAQVVMHVGTEFRSEGPHGYSGIIGGVVELTFSYKNNRWTLDTYRPLVAG